MKIKSLIDEKDLFFMDKALEQAQIAYDKNEVPIGAIVVSEGDIIGSGYNQVESLKSQAYHAELSAIKQAGLYKDTWRLENSTIYVTVEPCVMCFGLIGLSRISRLVYGASSPLFGYHLDLPNLPLLYQRHIKGVTQGVRFEQAEQLLKKFFGKKRRVRE